MDRLLPIGQFSTVCRLSVKALRHYGDLGLPTPARVDPATGYRYYRPAQARDAILIAMLRGLDVPLPTIRDMLQAETPRSRLDLLDAHRRAMERRLTLTRRVLASVDRLLRGDGDLLPYDVTVAAAAPRAIVGIRIATRPETEIPDTYAAVDRLNDVLDGHGIGKPRMILTVFRAARGGALDLDVCAEVEAVSDAPAGLILDVLPGGTTASVTHQGPYEELGLAHHALLAWVHEHGHVETGPVVEIYRNDPATVADPRDYLTDVQVSIG